MPPPGTAVGGAVGAAVYTGDRARPWAEAVAVRGGRIVVVGAGREMGVLIGPRTEVVDLRGRMLLPGFQDAHAHPLLGGTERLQCDLSGGQSAAEYRELIAAYAAAHPEREWIVGGGWWMAAFPGGTPTRQVIHPEDVPRFQALGVTANAQPLWACNEPQMTELTIPFLGPERTAWQYPFRELVRTGARLACGSDWPVSSANPLWGMHVAAQPVRAASRRDRRGACAAHPRRGPERPRSPGPVDVPPPRPARRLPCPPEMAGRNQTSSPSSSGVARPPR